MMITKTDGTTKDKRRSKSVLMDNRALSTQFIQNVVPDRMYFLRSSVEGISSFLSSSVKDLYKSLVLAFSLDSVDLYNFRKYIWPVAASGGGLILGEYLTEGLSQYQTGSPEYDFVYKLLFGAAILSYAALQRITEQEFKSTAAYSAAFASEVVAITYMYSSVYQSMQMALSDQMSPDYAFIASLGTSSLLVPSTFSYLTQKMQEQLIRYQFAKGGQRSDTAIISSGSTSVANMYFQVNHVIARELMSTSRLFQLGLISDNILNAQRIVQKFRNLPALLADLAPSTIKNMLAQQEKLKRDYEYNNSLHRVLRFTPQGVYFIEIPRYKLRTGDLVYCDKSIDLSSVQVSGELIALKRGEKSQFLEKSEQVKFSVNLKAQNGEDVWIEHRTKPDFTSNYKKIELHAIHDGKQPGVLVGDKLNLYGSDNIFIQIKPEKELLLNSNYEKKSVINQIIAQRKQKSVLYSILASIIMAGFLQRDITAMPAETIRLMFTLFQTMIPFSEAFLRDVVNSRLMKKLNRNLDDKPFETIDALRVVDLCNALGGYYHDRFPQGVAIISDKTGTLTTNKMDVLGLWTKEMPAKVQQLLKDKPEILLPEEGAQFASFEVFLSAFTNNPKELEPEEFAILEFYKVILNKELCLQVSIYGNNHFKKILFLENDEKEIETFHLGLYRSFGGRFTLVDEGNTKYLVFCGVPKQDSFKNSSLLQTYTTMHNRKGVLSRDWCLARTLISEDQFTKIKALFDEDNKKGIEEFIINNHDLLHQMVHYVTFIIDNPVKKGAEQFISQCREIQVPVFVATGDTTKAAENIARVLCPANANNMIVIHAEQVKERENYPFDEEKITKDATVIFSGINPGVITIFKQLLAVDKESRPVIIFAEMSTEQKGILARFLKDNQFFVVANGDGTNDVMMMKNSDIVIAHQAEDATFAPGVGPLANLSDGQLRQLFDSEKSFYELFDINLPRSLFIQHFAPLGNSQEKPTEALALKSGKLSFELFSALGYPVKEMFQQHWFSVGFDLIWLWIAFYEINISSELPMDNQNISTSSFISQTMALAMFIGIFQAIGNYALTGESTNFISMMLILILLPIVLKSIFSGFRMVQDRVFPETDLPVIEEEEHPESYSRGFIMGYLGSFFRKAPEYERQIQILEEESPEPN